MPAIRMFLLAFGTERVPKAISVLGAGREIVTEPIYGAVVETSEGLVLLDTGIGRAALDDVEALTAIYGSGHLPVGPVGAESAGDPLAVALASVDLTVADLGLAAISHLHLDHTGGLPLLARAGVRVAVQKEELDYGRHRAAAGTERDVAFYRSDYLDSDHLDSDHLDSDHLDSDSDHPIDWLCLDGGAELAPGVSVLPTPGHTPGHQSFRVDLAGTGTWILTADATDLAQNLHQATPCGFSAEPGDAPRAAASVHALLELAERTDARMLPGHDPIVWKAAWHPPGGHT
jgi:glyoxylase-like metal-dependent hydrolase (beta-lactamase superfamily II)